MIVIKTTQWTMKSVGVLFTAVDTIPYKIYRCFSFCIMCVMFVPFCFFLLENSGNLLRATEACIYITTEGVTVVKTMFMFYNYKLIRGVLEDLQRLTNKSISMGRGDFIVKMDNEAEKVCKRFLWMLVLAVTIYSGGPIAAILYRKFTNSYVPHMYGHPFKGVFPFDYKSTPGYELVYVLNVVYNINLALYFAACDVFFATCGLHLVGATQEVEDFLLRLDKEINDTQNGMNIAPNGQADIPQYLHQKLVEAVRDHYEVIRINDNLATIEGGVIFSQFLGVLFSLSTLGFQMVVVRGVQAVFFMGPATVILSEMFLFCYYGQRITDQACQLSQSIYQLEWYNYPIQFQKYFQLIMLRSQNASYFSGLGFVNCSLQSFTDVLKFVGSVVALFMNLQN